MGYLWDPEKAKANYQKHGVYFADAVYMNVNSTEKRDEKRI
jgi:uncharacterized DUF497 family protein